MITTPVARRSNPALKQFQEVEGKQGGEMEGRQEKRIGGTGHWVIQPLKGTSRTRSLLCWGSVKRNTLPATVAVITAIVGTTRVRIAGLTGRTRIEAGRVRITIVVAAATTRVVATTTTAWSYSTCLISPYQPSSPNSPRPSSSRL